MNNTAQREGEIVREVKSLSMNVTQIGSYLIQLQERLAGVVRQSAPSSPNKSAGVCVDRALPSPAQTDLGTTLSIENHRLSGIQSDISELLSRLEL